jgi:hypothetical protein
MKRLTIYEVDFAALIRGDEVTLHSDVTVVLSAVLTVECIAAHVVAELSDRYKLQALAAAVVPETKRRLS